MTSTTEGEMRTVNTVDLGADWRWRVAVRNFLCAVIAYGISLGVRPACFGEIQGER